MTMLTIIHNRIGTMLALLLTGSASMLANGDDPFPEVSASHYQGNMTLTAKAEYKGEVLGSEVVVAVYHDDEIRAKGRPDEEGMLYLTVNGNVLTEDLYFKIFHQGRIVETDQGFEYKYYSTVGSYDQPYIIDVPPSFFTPPAVDGWTTVCLPIHAAVPEGVTVYAVTGIEDDHVQKVAIGETLLPKEMPVIIHTESTEGIEWLPRVISATRLAELSEVYMPEPSYLKGTTEDLPVDEGAVLTFSHQDPYGWGFWPSETDEVSAYSAYLTTADAGAEGLALNMVVLDENGTETIEAAQHTNVLVKRTIHAGEWSSICLPFAMTESQVRACFGDDVQLANFTGCESTYDQAGENIVGLTVTFENAPAMEANHPYIIKVSGDITKFKLAGVDVAPGEANASVGCNGKTEGGETRYNRFVGTYHAATEVPALCLFLSGNKFWYSTGKTKMKAFRAYFDFYYVLSSVTEENAGARIAMSFDDTVTNICENEDANRGTRGGAIYNLRGQRLSKPGKGLHIIDGKLVIKR